MAATVVAGRPPVTRRDRGRVRVLQVVTRFPPDMGGLETHVSEISRRLAGRDDLEVTVLATDRHGTLPLHEVTPEGVTVHRRRAWPASREFYLAPGLHDVIRRGGWDVVHVQGIHTALPLFSMTAAASAGIPYVVSFHTGGHSSGLRNGLRSAQWRALAPLLRRAYRLVAVSRFERGVFVRATGIAAERFEVVRNGGSLPRATGVVPVPGRIVSSGRLERYKGHHRVLEAMPLVLRRFPEAHLHVLGAGPTEQELRDTARRLSVGRALTIEFVPAADRDRMARCLAEASVFAQLSDYEAHPVAVMEALAAGVPVIGTDTAGIGDLVEEGLVTGLRRGAGSEVVAEALLGAMSGPRPAPRTDLPTWDGAAERLAGLYLEAAVLGRHAAASGRA